MARLYLNQTLKQAQIVQLSKDQRHYLEKVLRLQPGQNFLGFNEHDGEWQIVYDKLDCRCTAQTRTPCLKKTPSWLAFAPLKHDPMGFLLEKATELGVTDLQPVFTEHTNTQRVNLMRWQKNVIEAAEQCERLDVPMVHPPLALIPFLQKLPAEIHWYSAIERSNNGTVNLQFPAGFIIGPEGGWSKAEQSILNQYTTNISLGCNILRAETAAIVCLAIKNFKNLSPDNS